jgi:hypothetical protein
MDSLRWTPYMDDCLSYLEQNAEWHGDYLLAQQVKCQLITDKILEVPWQGHSEGPPVYYLKALESQIQGIRMGLKPEFREDRVAQLFILSTEISIYETAHQWPFVPGELSLQRINYFNSCLRSLQEYYKIYFTLSPSAYRGINFNLFAQAAGTLIALLRLTLVDDPSWDKEATRQTCDVIQILEQMAKNLEDVPKHTGLIIDDEEENIFANAAKIMRNIKAHWESEITANQLNSLTQSAYNEGFNLLDDFWLEGLMVE